MCTTECTEFPGFYTIPGIDTHAVSKDGRVINLFTGKELSQFSTSSGYKCVHLKNNDHKNELVHRLVARAFVDNPENKCQINHIDGNKLNNTVDNLEWVTPKENCEHAGRLGLSQKCCAVDVMDSNGKIFEFPSFIECAKFFNMSKDEVSNRVNSSLNGDRLFPEGRRYRKHSNDPWSIEISSKYGRNMQLDVMDLTTGKVFRNMNLTNVSNLVNISMPRLYCILKDHDQPVVPNMFVIKKSSDKTWRKIGDPILEISKVTKRRPVQVFNPVTKDMKIYSSCLDCAKDMNILPTTLNERLKHHGVVYSDGYMYGYYPFCVNSPLSSKDGGCKDT